jgi:hypothetical protein
MITVFFAVDGIALLEILSTGSKLTSDYFCYNIIEALEQVTHPDCRVPGTTRSVLHFDNAAVHKAQKGQQKLDEREFRPLKHPPYPLDLAPDNFFLFGGLHEKIQILCHGTVDEL